MAGFRFRLQAVATLRKQVRDRVAEALAEVQESIRIVQEQLTQLEREVEENLRQRHIASTGVIRTDRLLLIQRHQLMLDAQRLQIRQHLQALNEEYDRRRQVLIEAEKEVRVMEKLEQSQHAQWEFEQLAAEQKQIDEWASTQYLRNKK